MSPHLNRPLRTEADVARGYVESPAATRFAVNTNSADGYVVAFRTFGDLIQNVVVTGLNAPLVFADAASERVVPAARTTAHRLNYRFELLPGTQPGSYPWPLEISLRAF